MKTTHERFNELFPIVNIGRDIKFNEIDGKIQIKAFIDKEIDLAKEEERKRILGLIRDRTGIITDSKRGTVTMVKVFDFGGLRDYVDKEEYINKVDLVKDINK